MEGESSPKKVSFSVPPKPKDDKVLENITIILKKDDRCFKAGDTISIDLHEGVNFVVGPNGSGKTTLMHYIRAQRHDLRELNKKIFDGMGNDDDKIYGRHWSDDKSKPFVSSVFDIQGLDRFDQVFVLDSIDDDPTSFTNSATAAGLIGGGGFAALSASKGQKAGMMLAKFISGIAKVTGFTPKDYNEGKNYNKHSLIVIDEVDEGLDIKHQVKFVRFIERMCKVWNATIICICHNPLCTLSDGTMDAEVYDLSTRSSKTIKQYIFDQTGLWLNVEKTETMDEKIKPNTW